MASGRVALQTLSQTTMFDIVRFGEFVSDVECTRGKIDVLKNDFTDLGKSMSPIWIISAAVSTWTTSTCGTTRHPSQTEASAKLMFVDRAQATLQRTPLFGNNL